jgi:hypothetical protein
LARANPKKILSKKEVGTKRVAEDDSKALEMKRRKMNADILPTVEKAKVQKNANDDSELLTSANKLRNVNVNKFKPDETIRYTEKFKDFLELAKDYLNKNDPVKNMLNKLANTLDGINVSKFANISKNIKTIASQIHIEAKKGDDCVCVIKKRNQDVDVVDVFKV